MKSKVILLAGAGGSGKSTIAELISRQHGYELLDGDHEDSEFFPYGGQWLPQNLKSLQKAHRKILSKTKLLVSSGKSVVVDYVIFGDYSSYFKIFEDTFRDDLKIVILYPSNSENIKRDFARSNWTTGPVRIAAVRLELYKIRNKIGVEKFLDTSNESPEETIIKYFQFF